MAQAWRATAASVREAAVTQLATSRGPAVSLVTQLASDEPAQPSRIGDELAPLPEADQLVIARAGEAPRTQKLDKPTMTVGRDEDNDITLDAPEVSAKHARLQQSQRGWQVSDLDSTNGTYLDDNRLLPNVPEQWQMGQMLRLGPYFVRWQQATEQEAGTGASRYQATQISVGASQIESAAGQLSVVVNPTEATVAAGDQTDVQVTLFNQGDTVGRFQLNVEDLPSSWVTMSQDTVNLMPGEQTELSVALHPPQDSQATAGSHPYRLVVSSTLEEQAAVFSGQLIVDPFERFDIEVSPVHLDHGQSCQVTVRNQGNADTSYQVTGQDPAQAIRFEGEQTVTVPAGQEKTTSLTLSAKEQPFTGRKQTLPFAVQVSTAASKEKTQVGQLTVPPRYSIGCLALAAVLLLLMAAATCCLSGLPGGGDGGGTRRTPAPPAIEEEVEPAEPVEEEAPAEPAEEELAPQSRKEIEAVSASPYAFPLWPASRGKTETNSRWAKIHNRTQAFFTFPGVAQVSNLCYAARGQRNFCLTPIHHS
jgi:pSer/pThr/pTyr-binding forkhead associated (FHA) protein